MSGRTLDNLQFSEETQDNMYMTFSIINVLFAVKVNSVKTVTGFTQIEKLSDRNSYIRGLTSIRGTIVPVVDVRLRFEQDYIEYTDRTYIIVVEVKSILIGLIVDKVLGVAFIEPNRLIALPPVGYREERDKYIDGVGKIDNNIKFFIDAVKLFDANDINLFNHMIEQKMEEQRLKEEERRREEERLREEERRRQEEESLESEDEHLYDDEDVLKDEDKCLDYETNGELI